MSTFLNIKDLHVRYRTGNPVLGGLSLTLEAGELTALMGPSGAGKTTLLRAVAGLLRNYRGSTATGEVTIGGLSPDEARARGLVGMMFQEDYLMPHLSLLENVRLPLRLLHRPLGDISESLLRLVGLENDSAQLPARLSGGMRARVALARAFVTQPKFVLLDEPFGSLDLSLKAKLYLDFKKLVEINHSTGMLISHDLEDAIALCDSAVFLGRSGRLSQKLERGNQSDESFRHGLVSALTA